MSADELIDLINEEPRIQVIDSYDPGEADTGGEVNQRHDPYSPLPPPSQLMPRPPFMPRPPTDSECIYCSNGFLQGFAEQYWEDHLRQQADRGAGPLPDDLPDPSAKIMNAETTSTDQSTDQSTPAATQFESLDSQMLYQVLDG